MPTKVKELFAHVPEELRLEKVELNRAEIRVCLDPARSAWFL
jgi:hypothetical protein